MSITHFWNVRLLLWQQKLNQLFNNNNASSSTQFTTVDTDTDTTVVDTTTTVDTTTMDSHMEPPHDLHLQLEKGYSERTRRTDDDSSDTSSDNSSNDDDNNNTANNRSTNSSSSDDIEIVKTKIVCLSRCSNLFMCTGALALYLFLWVFNATLLQGLASGSLSPGGKPYNKPFFLTWFDNNFHMLGFIPVYFYVRFQRGWSFTYYVKHIWADRFNLKRTLIVCVSICYLLIFQNTFYIAGLECINVPTSNAVYQLQTGFTIMLSVMLFGDSFTNSEAVGMMVSLGGIILIVTPPLLPSDREEVEIEEDMDPRLSSCDARGYMAVIYGVLATALSSMLWGLFQVLLRWQFDARHDENISKHMTHTEGIIDTLTTLGFFALSNFLVGWPLTVIFHFAGIEIFEAPHVSQWGMMLLNAVFEYLFDFSCALAVYVTSPIMTAITAPLVIPLGLLTDYLLYETEAEADNLWWYLAGSFFVLLGTILIEVKPRLCEVPDKNMDLRPMLSSTDEAKAVDSI